MTETIDKAEQREQWMGLLNAASMFHQQIAKDTTSEIIGAEESEDTLFHKAISVAIMDAMHLIKRAEELGLFDEELSKPGLAG